MATAIIGPPFTGGMQKFKDLLPDLKSAIATPDTATFPGSDFYIIGLVQYTAAAAVHPAHAPLPGPQFLRATENVGMAAAAADGDERRVFAQDQGGTERVAGHLEG